MLRGQLYNCTVLCSFASALVEKQCGVLQKTFKMHVFPRDLFSNLVNVEISTVDLKKYLL